MLVKSVRSIILCEEDPLKDIFLLLLAVSTKEELDAFYGRCGTTKDVLVVEVMLGLF